jgi:tRNA pseudouridine55 synthase
MPYDHITKEKLDNALRYFIGQIKQVPPIYSAKKIKGVRASDRAKAGEFVQLKPVNVTVKSLVCTNFDLPFFTIGTNF